jgi:hypothetical protein
MTHPMHAVDDPLQPSGIGVKLGRDAWQGDVDDRDVEVDGKDRDVDAARIPALRLVVLC